jgi:O-antigen/teichoic acid export membrane protein
MNGAAWSVLGAVASSGINLLAVMVLARILGKDSYGQLAVIQSTLAMAGVFAGIGLSSTATRYVAELRQVAPARLGNLLYRLERITAYVAAALTLLIALFSSNLASDVLGKDNIGHLLAFAVISVFFVSLDSLYKGILLGLEETKAFAIASSVGSLLTAPILIIGGIAYGLVGVSCAISVGALLQFAISRYFTCKRLPAHQISIRKNADSAEWQALNDFALPSFLSGLLYPLVYWISNVLLVRTSHGFAEMALLGIAMQWYNAIMFLPNYAGRIVLPILTSIHVEKENSDVIAIIKLGVIANLLVTVPVSIGVALLSKLIMTTYGSGFIEGWPVLALAALVAMIVVGIAPVGQYLAAVNRMWVGFMMNFAWAIVFLLSTVALAPYGAIGILASFGIAYVAHGIWSFGYARRHILSI